MTTVEGENKQSFDQLTESSANLPSNPTRIVQETSASNEDALNKLKKQKQLKNEVSSPNSNGEASLSESSKENQKRGGGKIYLKNGDTEPAKLLTPKDVQCSLEEVENYIKRPNSNIKWAERINYGDLCDRRIIKDIVIDKGLPLVLDNSTQGWNEELFSWNWLKKNYSDVPLVNSPRNNDTFMDLTGWTVGNYIDYINLPVEQRNPPRLYGKDMPCPDEWKDYVATKIPPWLVYRGKYDIISDLEEELQALSLMIYIGFEGNWTPGHKDICGSLGHNVMVYSDPNAYALWFVIASRDMEKASQFWKEAGGQLDWDNFFIPLEKLAKAPFDVYAIVQRKGDFVLVPPNAPHEVLNKGGRNVKVSWNTITTQSILISHHTVPYYQSLSKPEIYRISATSYAALKNRTLFVEREEKIDDPQKKQLLEDLPPLLEVLWDNISQEQINLQDIGPPLFTPDKIPTKVEIKKFEDSLKHARICNFCRCDIFNRCFHCFQCTEEDEFDLCVNCVALGRGCAHTKDLLVMEYIPHRELIDVLERGEKALKKIAESIPNSPVFERKPKKTISDATIAFVRVILQGEQSKEYCHQCKRPKETHRLLACTNKACKVRSKKKQDEDEGKDKNKGGKRYCDSCLYNRSGIRWIDCVRNKSYVCLYCQGKCNCADCLRKRGKDPYNPEHVFDSTLASVQSFADTAIDVNDKWASSIDMKPPRPQIHLFKKKNKEESDVLEYSPSNGKTSKRRSLSKDLKKESENSPMAVEGSESKQLSEPTSPAQSPSEPESQSTAISSRRKRKRETNKESQEANTSESQESSTESQPKTPQVQVSSKLSEDTPQTLVPSSDPTQSSPSAPQLPDLTSPQAQPQPQNPSSSDQSQIQTKDLPQPNIKQEEIPKLPETPVIDLKATEDISDIPSPKKTKPQEPVPTIATDSIASKTTIQSPSEPLDFLLFAAEEGNAGNGKLSKWVEMFNKLKQFKDSNGHCEVPRNHELHRWVHEMHSRHKMGTLKPHKRRRLEQLGFFWKVESPLPKELGGRKTKNSSESRYEAAAEYFESSLPMSKRRKKAIVEPEVEEERSIPLSKRRRSNINANSNTTVPENHESEENEEAALDKCAFTLADLADMADKIPLPEPKSELESETSPQAESQKQQADGKRRIFFTPNQIAPMQMWRLRHPNAKVSNEVLEDLSKKSGLTVIQVKRWLSKHKLKA